jgi:hypothetical protein
VVIRHLVENAHCFADFCGDRVNCSNIRAEETGLVAVQGLEGLCTSRTQICQEYVKLLIVDVPLQIQADTVFALRTHFQISSTTSKLPCVERKIAVPPPFP